MACIYMSRTSAMYKKMANHIETRVYMSESSARMGLDKVTSAGKAAVSLTKNRAAMLGHEGTMGDGDVERITTRDTIQRSRKKSPTAGKCKDPTRSREDACAPECRERVAGEANAMHDPKLERRCGVRATERG